MKTIWIISNDFDHTKLKKVTHEVAEKLGFEIMDIKPYTIEVENWMETVNLLNGNHNKICELQEIYRSKNKSVVIGYPLSQLVYDFLGKNFNLTDYQFYNLDFASELNFAEKVKESDSIDEIVTDIIHKVNQKI